MILKDELEEM